MAKVIKLIFEEKNDEIINLSFSLKERKLMEESAFNYGMNLEEWIRTCVAKEIYRDES